MYVGSFVINICFLPKKSCRDEQSTQIHEKNYAFLKKYIYFKL